MSVAAVSPIALAAPGLRPANLTGGGLGAAGGASGAAGSDPGADFAAQLGKGLQQLQATHDKADDLAVRAATGSLSDVQDFMIASTQATLTTQLTVAVRNKALEAFNEIMRLQG